MKLPIFILLSALASIAGAWTEHELGTIKNFIWPKDSKDLPSFRSREYVLFHDSYFENFSRVIGNQLIRMKRLACVGGTVLQVFLKHNIEDLHIAYTKTTTIEIDPEEEYATVSLNVFFCELTSIPKNINHLNRLKMLELSFNKIEHIKMDDFNGLTHLEKLVLYYNRIKTLSSGSTIHLPKLRFLDLSSNNLQEINVCSWDMPPLEEFYLNGNKLKFVINLVDQFPKLKTISIHGNPLVCPWMADLVRSLKSKNISQKDENATCNATDTTYVPIECPSVYSLSIQLSNLLERQRSFEASSSDQMEKSAKKIESLEQTVSSLDDHFKKANEESQSLRQSMEIFKQRALGKQLELEQTVETLRHLIDDMTEGFYRYVVEKEGGEK